MVKSLFLHQKSPQPTGSSDGNLFRLTMAYDGSGRRISKTRWVKSANSQDWEKELVTHYTGIGTEIREIFTGPAAETKVVVNMPNGLGRYGIEDAAAANANASKNFEWYLKNHLGSTMLVYGTVASTNPSEADVGEKIAAYDYRAFGEMVELTPPPTDKVTENFTGSRFARRTQRTACKSIAEPKNLGAKRNEHDDEIALDYFGARYLDPMLGMWISVDPARQFASPYLYAGNGYNPVNAIDPDGNLVTGTYNKSTGLLTLTDNDTKKSVSGQYFTGGKPYGEPIPTGKYEILDHVPDKTSKNYKPGRYRLDAIDAKPRNDIHEPTGRINFRLHGFGNSTGCITACENTNHKEIDDFIQKTKTEPVEIKAPERGLFGKIWDFITDTEPSKSNIHQKYGEIEVIDGK